MNSATKFDSFKQSLASMGKNSQAQVSPTQQTNLTNPVSQIQNTTNMINNQDASQIISGSNYQSSAYQNNVQYPSGQYPSGQYQSSTYQNNVGYTSGGRNAEIPIINSTGIRNTLQDSIYGNIQNQQSHINNASNIHNPSNISRGAIRSAIKFDYELGGMKIASNNIKKVAEIPSANIFSCMDNPNYQRDFEVSPKVMHK